MRSTYSSSSSGAGAPSAAVTDVIAAFVAATSVVVEPDEDHPDGVLSGVLGHALGRHDDAAEREVVAIDRPDGALLGGAVGPAHGHHRADVEQVVAGVAVADGQLVSSERRRPTLHIHREHRAESGEVGSDDV